MIDTHFGMQPGLLPIPERIRVLHEIQTETPLEALAAWHLGIRGAPSGAESPARRAGRALAGRDFGGAAQLYLTALRESPNPEDSLLLAYATCMSGGLAHAGLAPEHCDAVARIEAGPR